jgi:hypothetical protein
LRPVAHLELGEHVGYVVAHRLVGQVQPPGDVEVAAPVRDQLQDLDLPVGELGERPGRAAARGCRGEEGQRPGGDPGAEDDVTCRDRLDGPDDLVPFGALDQVAASSGPHRGEQRLVVVEHGEHQDGGAWAAGGDLAGGLDAAGAGHVQVHQHDVGAEFARRRHRGRAVAGLSDDADTSGVGEGRA